jgi:hypothetical protein
MRAWCPAQSRRRRRADSPRGRLLSQRQHIGGLDEPFIRHIDEFRIAHVQRFDSWIETTWNNMSDPGVFAATGAEEQQGGEPPPLAGAGVVVSLMG